MPSTALTLVPRASRKEWLGLAIIALPCMIYSMDLTILNLAMPAIAADLKPSASELLWIIDIYGFMVAGFLIVMGAAGDRFGRRRILLIGAALFGIMSVAAAFAHTAEQLILARALLGIAGATLAPSTLSLITNMFRDEIERTFAISMWIASFSVGAVLGPLAGGLVIQHFGWGAAFLVGVPVMALLLVLGPWLLPEFRAANPPRLDYVSALLSLMAVLTFIYGVKRVAEIGLDAWAVAGLLIGGAISLIFVMRQRRLDDPLIDLALFRSPAFTVALTVNMLALFFMFGLFIFMAQYLQLVAGLTALEAGFWSLPGAVAFTAMSFCNARLSTWFSDVHILAGGLLVGAMGFVGVYFTAGLLGIVGWMMVVSVGFTPVIALTTGYVVGAVPPEKAGVAAAISETAVELGGALGIAVLGSFATFIYRARMAEAVPAGTENAAALRGSLAMAVEGVKALPMDVGAPILAAARGAFMASYHATALLAAVVLGLLAVLVMRVLRGVRAAGH